MNFDDYENVFSGTAYGRQFFEDLMGRVRSDTASQSYQQYASAQSAPTERQLCERFCQSLKTNGCQLRWVESGGLVQLEMRNAHGHTRRGSLQLSKRDALVRLAREVMPS